MKISESVELVNGDKAVFGKKTLDLTLDTDTGRVTMDYPAMFTDPVVSIHTLEQAIADLKEHMSQ